MTERKETVVWWCAYETPKGNFWRWQTHNLMVTRVSQGCKHCQNPSSPAEYVWGWCCGSVVVFIRTWFVEQYSGYCLSIWLGWRCGDHEKGQTVYIGLKYQLEGWYSQPKYQLEGWCSRPKAAKCNSVLCFCLIRLHLQILYNVCLNNTGLPLSGAWWLGVLPGL